MVERIPQHRHCPSCGKAFTGKDTYCSDVCQQDKEGEVKGRKRQLLMLWGLSAVVLIIALLAVM